MMTTTATKESPRRSELFNVRLWQETIDEEHLELRGQVQHVLSGETRYFRDWATLVAWLDTMVSTLESKSKGETQMEYQHPEYLVETDWLHAHLADANLRVLDCTAYLPNYFDASAAQKVEIVSGRDHYAQGHIPGSAFADIIHELSDQQNKKFMFPMPSAAQFAAAMSRYGVGEDSRVVLYDDMFNVWAARVWWMLRAFGFENAAVLNGGWKKWANEGRPIATEPSTYPAAHFVAHPRPERIATKDEVLAAIDSGATCLVNGLDPEEFAGRGPVRYGRPGHIPSSVNLPFIGVVDPATSLYLPPDQLQSLVQQSGATGKERVICYCGGAIAASSAAFALSLLGVENVALYDGSLTEWAADPALPLVASESL